MSVKEKEYRATQSRTPIYTEARHKPEAQMKISIGNDVFIINHTYTGTHTIQEVYEDFLKRAITNC